MSVGSLTLGVGIGTLILGVGIETLTLGPGRYRDTDLRGREGH